jgi:hypothetical protein
MIPPAQNGVDVISMLRKRRCGDGPRANSGDLRRRGIQPLLDLRQVLRIDIDVVVAQVGAGLDMRQGELVEQAFDEEGAELERQRAALVRGLGGEVVAAAAHLSLPHLDELAVLERRLDLGEQRRRRRRRLAPARHGAKRAAPARHGDPAPVLGQSRDRLTDEHREVGVLDAVHAERRAQHAAQLASNACSMRSRHTAPAAPADPACAPPPDGAPALRWACACPFRCTRAGAG